MRGVKLCDAMHAYAKCACDATALRKVRLCRAAFTLLRRKYVARPFETRWREMARPFKAEKRRAAASLPVERPEFRRRVDEIEESVRAQGRVASRAASPEDAVRGTPAVSEDGADVSAAGAATGVLFGKASAFVKGTDAP